ncbi:MAG: ABC transporter permease subunit [candidate division Zixibacteria bacterium]|nr:ABC transporter permease subunit [candidate division Zixibacteria bacterium]
MNKLFKKLKPIVKKEFRQVIRDRRTLAVLLFIPAFLITMFGYALNFDVKHIIMAVYDEDNSKLSREYARSFIHTEYFDLYGYLNDRDQIDNLMGNEVIQVALVIPHDFSNYLIAGKESKVQVIIDGANSNTATTVNGYVEAFTGDFSQKIMLKTFLKTGSKAAVMPIDFRPRIWFNPELKSAKFLIPGLIGFILMITAVVSTALSIVREKERNTIEQILVSPVNPLELVIGKVVPYILISLIAAAAVLLVGNILFDVVVNGSYLLLLLVTLIFLVACLGLGILISTAAETQQTAFMMATMITVLPTFILSGFVFPIRNMPEIIQAITYLVPARYYLVALRAIILKGVGITAFWDQILYLIAFGGLVLSVSIVRLRKWGL